MGTGSERVDGAVPVAGFGPLLAAGLASVGAGAIHLVAAAVHHAHAPAVMALAVLAVSQLAWGTQAFERRGRGFALVGIGVSAVAVGGWILAKSSGIAFLAGLREPEAMRLADLAAVLLSGSVLVLAARRALTPAGPVPAMATVSAWRPRRLAWAAVVAVVTVAALATVTSYGSGSDDDGAGARADEVVHNHGGAVAVAGGFDPSRPLDLSDVPGLTSRQNRAVKRLVTETLAQRPTYARSPDPAKGQIAIASGSAGFVQVVNAARLGDGATLDPRRPEAFVYRQDSKGRASLVAVRFLLAPGASLGGAPDVGGPLTKWAPLDDLCGSGPTGAPTVLGASDVAGRCPPGQRELLPLPSLDLWVVANPCGPFAPLESVRLADEAKRNRGADRASGDACPGVQGG